MTAKKQFAFSLLAATVTFAAFYFTTTWRVATILAPLALTLTYIVLDVFRGLSNSYLKRSFSPGRDNLSRLWSDAGVIIAGAGSIMAVLATLSTSQASRFASASLTVLVTLLSWAMIQMLFAEQYASKYTQAGRKGIEFGDEESTHIGYLDFLYFSFTIGTTFSVSDNSITIQSIRRTALLHSLLSFLFGTFVLACSTNLILSILG